MPTLVSSPHKGRPSVAEAPPQLAWGTGEEDSQAGKRKEKIQPSLKHVLVFRQPGLK